MKYIYAEVILPEDPEMDAIVNEIAEFGSLEEAERFEKGILN